MLEISSKTSSSISIVIPTLGRETLHALLASLERAIRYSRQQNSSFQCEVLLILDPKTRSTERFLNLEGIEELLKVYHSPKGGVNVARNFGAQFAQYETLVFLDDDVELIDVRFLEYIGQSFGSPSVHRAEIVVAIGGSYRTQRQAGIDVFAYNCICTWWREVSSRPGRDLLLGGCLAFQKRLWSNLGGFDSEIEYGGTETSFLRKIHVAEIGQTVYSPKLDVYHNPAGRSFLEWMTVAFKQGLRKIQTQSILPPTRSRAHRFLYLVLESVGSERLRFFQALPFFICFAVASQIGFICGAFRSRATQT